MTMNTLIMRYALKEEVNYVLEDAIRAVLESQGFKFFASGFNFRTRERDLKFEREDNNGGAKNGKI